MKELIEEYGSVAIVWIVGMAILTFGGYIFNFVSANI